MAFVFGSDGQVMCTIGITLDWKAKAAAMRACESRWARFRLVCTFDTLAAHETTFFAGGLKTVLSSERLGHCVYKTFLTLFLFLIEKPFG
jgi:hypothetical protein